MSRGNAKAVESQTCDVLLVGGGLANSLIALELKARRPELKVILLEQDARAADDHTWSVFRSDLSAEAWALLEPIFEQRWNGYSVAFPQHVRQLPTPYACLTRAGLDAAVAAALGENVRRGRRVASVGPERVVCEDQEAFSGRLVIDGRGARPSPHLEVAFQKFVGLDVRLKRPHGLDAPIVMDATVRQADGYRFLYTLPLGPDRLLIEDTRYSDGAQLGKAELETEVTRYARANGWQIADVIRRESGVLPVVLGGDIEAYWDEAVEDVPQVGMRGAFFHPTTGYSLPDAARVAELVAGASDLDSPALARLLRAESVRLWKGRTFYRLLNRMLFLAAEPDRRYRVLERFYRLPTPLIERFYAGRSTLLDKARVLSGRPPVPVARAIRALRSNGVAQHA